MEIYFNTETRRQGERIVIVDGGVLTVVVRKIFHHGGAETPGRTFTD
jgi:hypothetical protein